MATAVYADRVAEITNTSGTGTITLGGVLTNDYQTFATAFGTGSIPVYYCIIGGSDWEVGQGTFVSSSDTLTRDHIYSSSNAGSVVSLAAIQHTVFCTAPAAQHVDMGRAFALSPINIPQ